MKVLPAAPEVLPAASKALPIAYATQLPLKHFPQPLRVSESLPAAIEAIPIPFMAVRGGYLIKTYSEGCCSNKIHEAADRDLEAYGKASEAAGRTSKTAW